MYIHVYTKIEIQTNTHIPITPSPHRKHSYTSARTQSTFTQKKQKRSGDTTSTINTANEADLAYVCDSKRGYRMQLEK